MRGSRLIGGCLVFGFRSAVGSSCLMAILPVVSTIEAGPFEDDPDTSANQLLHWSPASRTISLGFLGDFLSELEYPTVRASILVNRHLQTTSRQTFDDSF